MKVLFSPIGSTDPVSNLRDGGMLHICRVYRPDKVYLYLSKEMCKYHDFDNRYEKAIRFLEQESQWHCEIEIIRDETMENVQLFDAFIDSFEEILENIRRKDKSEEILVNISSGTPAMKSSLQMLSMLYNDILAIQVSTPAKSSNKRHEDKDDYDIEIQWECNEDRKEGFENRCIVSNAKHLTDRLRKENIQKYILAYDYEAAKMLVETLSTKPSEEFSNCLNIAIARTRLDLKYVNGNRKKCDMEAYFPIVDDREMKEYEYLLVMQMKLWKKQYADFIRDITPIFYSLSEKLLKKCCDLRFEDIGEKKEGKWFLSLRKLEKAHIKPRANWGDYMNISSYIILEIMKQCCKNDKIREIAQRVRTAEREVRNLAAHEIVGVTEKWIEERTHFTPEQIMDLLFEMAKYSGINIDEQSRNIYNKMNGRLIALL